MLPLWTFPPCPNCFFMNQGTRAKAGSSIACWDCDIKRWVPVDRPTQGLDDPFAIRPVRGRPLQPGHPYRFTSQQESYS